MSTARALAKSGRDNLADRIAAAVAELDIRSMPAWDDLAPLSKRTSVDGLNAHPAGIDIEGNTFNGLLTVYVVLEYDKEDGTREFITSDSVPGQFFGHFDENNCPVIDDVKVNTRRFYK